MRTNAETGAVIVNADTGAVMPHCGDEGCCESGDYIRARRCGAPPFAPLPEYWISRAYLTSIGEHYEPGDPYPESWQIVLRIPGEPSGCMSFVSLNSGAAAVPSGHVLITDIGDYEQLPQDFDGQIDPIRPEEGHGGCEATRCWTCAQCESEHPHQYEVTFSGVRFCPSPWLVNDYGGTVQTSYVLDDADSINKTYTLGLRMYGQSACAWYVEEFTGMTITISNPYSSQLYNVLIRVDIQPGAGVLGGQPQWALLMTYRLYVPGSYEPGTSGGHLNDWGFNWGNIFVGHISVPDGCCVVTGSVNNENFRANPDDYDAPFGAPGYSVGDGYVSVRGDGVTYHPRRGIFCQSPAHEYNNNPIALKFGHDGYATITPLGLIDDTPCATPEADPLSSWSSEPSSSSPSSTSSANPADTSQSTPSSTSSDNPLDTSESSDGQPGAGSASSDSDGQPGAGSASSASDDQPGSGSGSSAGDTVESDGQPGEGSASSSSVTCDCECGFSRNSALGAYAPVTSCSCGCDYSAATALIADASTVAPNDSPTPITCPQVEPSESVDCEGCNAPDICWFSGRHVEHQQGGPAQFVYESPELYLCANEFNYYRFAGVSSDDVCVLLHADDDIITTYSGAIGDPAHFDLPPSAIIFRNTRGWLISNSFGGTCEKTFSNGLGNYTFPAGSASTHLTGAVADLEAGGFATRSWLDGISRADLMARGWIDSNGIARIKFAHVVCGSGDVTIPEGSIECTNVVPLVAPCQYDDVPAVLRLVVAGITGSGCDGQNGEFELTRNGITWFDEDDRWALTCAGGTWQLTDLRHDCLADVPENSSASSDSSSSSSQSTAWTCPVDWSGCPECLAVSITGTGYEVDTVQEVARTESGYTATANGFPVDCPSYTEGATISTVISCTGATWQIVRYSNAGPSCSTGATITFTAPVTSACPPSTGWTVTSNGFGGTPTLTVSECDNSSSSTSASSSSSSDTCTCTDPPTYITVVYTSSGLDGTCTDEEILMSSEFAGGPCEWIPVTSTGCASSIFVTLDTFSATYTVTFDGIAESTKACAGGPCGSYTDSDDGFTFFTSVSVIDCGEGPP